MAEKPIVSDEEIVSVRVVKPRRRVVWVAMHKSGSLCYIHAPRFERLKNHRPCYGAGK